LQAILYLARLHTDNLNPLLKEAFELSKSQGVSNNHEAYSNKVFFVPRRCLQKIKGTFSKGVLSIKVKWSMLPFLSIAL
jgi:hypothetical protein